MPATVTAGPGRGRLPRRGPARRSRRRQEPTLGCRPTSGAPPLRRNPADPTPEGPMDYFQAVILGIVEGLTEFLPISSTGHLTIAEQLLGLQVDAKDVTAFTAVIQVGAIAAVVLYFWRDIVRIVVAWVR